MGAICEWLCESVACIKFIDDEEAGDISETEAPANRCGRDGEEVFFTQYRFVQLLQHKEL